jgi:hypothetical protein
LVRLGGLVRNLDRNHSGETSPLNFYEPTMRRLQP